MGHSKTNQGHDLDGKLTEFNFTLDLPGEEVEIIIFSTDYASAKEQATELAKVHFPDGVVKFK